MSALFRKTALAAIGASALLHACGETLPASTDPDGGAGGVVDAASDSILTADAPPPTTCDRATAFGAPADVFIVGDWSVEAARFTANRSFAYLALCPKSDASNGCDLYVDSFEDGGLTFHNRMSASSPDYDSYPTVTADGRLLVFASRRDDAGYRMYFAAAVNGVFDGVVPIEQRFQTPFTFVNEPYLLGTGSALYFAAKTANDWDIYLTREWGTDAAANAILVPGLGSGFDKVAPVVSDDELEIFFGSNSATGNEITGYDIYRATRSDPTAAFGASERLGSLSGSVNDWPVWVSPDHCDLYFVNRDPTSGFAVLRVASRR